MKYLKRKYPELSRITAKFINNKKDNMRRVEIMMTSKDHALYLKLLKGTMNKPIKVKLKPIEFNLSLGGEPTREEVKQAYLELLINDKFDYELIITAKIKEQEL